MLTLLNHFKTFSLLFFLSPHKEESELTALRIFNFLFDRNNILSQSGDIIDKL